MLQVNKTKRHKRINELLDMYNRIGIYKDEITSLDYIQGQLIGSVLNALTVIYMVVNVVQK